MYLQQYLQQYSVYTPEYVRNTINTRSRKPGLWICHFSFFLFSFFDDHFYFLAQLVGGFTLFYVLINEENEIQ